MKGPDWRIEYDALMARHLRLKQAHEELVVFVSNLALSALKDRALTEVGNEALDVLTRTKDVT